MTSLEQTETPHRPGLPDPHPAKDKLTGVELFRLICCLLVVCLHYFPTPAAGLAWVEDVFHKGLCRGAVPFFFVASGFFCGLKKNEDSQARSRRLKRLLLLWLFWLAIGLGFGILGKSLPETGTFREKINFLYFVFIGGGFNHLWFLPALFLTTFWFGIAERRLGLPASLAIALCCYLTGLAGGLYTELSGFNLPGNPRDFIWFSSLPFGIGWLMASKPAFRGNLRLGISITVLATALHWLRVRNLQSPADYAEATFLIGAGMMMISLNIRPPARVAVMSRHTLGIYCIHFFPATLPFLAPGPMFSDSLPLLFVPPVLMYLSCYFICAGLSRTPVRQFVG